MSHYLHHFYFKFKFEKTEIRDLRRFVYPSSRKLIKKQSKFNLSHFLGDLRHFQVINKC